MNTIKQQEQDIHQPNMIAGAAKAVILCFALTVVTGLVYPFAVTGAGQLLFPSQSHGSIVTETVDGKEVAVGSALIGQSFEATPFFKGRPSANPNPSVSGGTNYGPMHPDVKAFSEEQVRKWQGLKGTDEAVPVDLVTQSASGHDPHISRAAARYQASIVARDTGVPEEKLLELIEGLDERGLFGRHHYVNLLALNLEVKKLMAANTK